MRYVEGAFPERHTAHVGLQPLCILSDRMTSQRRVAQQTAILLENCLGSIAEHDAYGISHNTIEKRATIGGLIIFHLGLDRRENTIAWTHEQLYKPSRS